MGGLHEKVSELEKERNELTMWMSEVNDCLQEVKSLLTTLVFLLKGEIPKEDLLAPRVPTPGEVEEIMEKRRKQKEAENPYLVRPRPVD